MRRWAATMVELVLATLAPLLAWALIDAIRQDRRWRASQHDVDLSAALDAAARP